MKTELRSETGRKPRRWILNTITLAALAGIGIAALSVNTAEPVSAQPPIPAGYALSSWQDNGRDGQYLLEYSAGQLPARGSSVEGVVLSDESCAPDEEGVNHCVNTIRLADNSELVLINNHVMSINRCLKPGEIVSLRTYNSEWAIVLSSDTSIIG